MKSISVSISVVVLAVAAVAACTGKLEVGDDANGEGVREGESRSTTGGTGGAGGTGTDGAGGTMPGTTTGGEGGDPGETCWLDEDARTPAVSGSSEGCPAGPVCPDSECETEGLTCRYHYDSTYNEECFCVRTRNEGQIWSCSIVQDVAGCPNEAPEHGSDCYGYLGISCSYLESDECHCSASSETWDCPRPEPKEEPDPPEGVDPTRLVGELTDEERETWCEWYSRIDQMGPGYPPVADRPVKNGYTVGAGCKFDDYYCHAAVPTLSKAQCIANLSLSECESPLAHLTGCAIDMASRPCAPFDYSCIDYLQSPNCEGSIVLDVTALGRCDVRVE